MRQVGGVWAVDMRLQCIQINFNDFVILATHVRREEVVLNFQKQQLLPATWACRPACRGTNLIGAGEVSNGCSVSGAKEIDHSIIEGED